MKKNYIKVIILLAVTTIAGFSLGSVIAMSDNQNNKVSVEQEVTKAQETTEIQTEKPTETTTTQETTTVPETTTVDKQKELAKSLLDKSSKKSLNNKLINTASKVPEDVLYFVLCNGYKLDLVSNPADYYEKNIVICGLTDVKVRKIYIKTNSLDFRRAVVHEIGHAFDCSLGTGFINEYGVHYSSDNNEFQDIYNAEVNSLKVHDYITDGHYKENLQEYFAEAFQEYVYHPDKLKANCPKTYSYIKNLIKEVKDICSQW